MSTLTTQVFALLVFWSYFTSCALNREEASLDPLSNFCGRWNHQSQLKNGLLFINGGVETFRSRSPVPAGPQPNYPPYNYTSAVAAGPNLYTIVVNMSSGWDWQSNISEIAINESNVRSQSTGAFAPIFQQAGLFQGPLNDTNIYLYGGSSPDVNTSFPGYQPPQSSQYTLWGFDTITHAWTQHDVSSTAPERPSWGAHTEARQFNLAFYLNGIISSDSSTADRYLLNNTLYLEGLVVLNLETLTASNFSTTTFNNGNPTAGGQLVYIPNYGSHGILVHLGGATGEAGQPRTSAQVSPLNSMNTISVFDVSTVLSASNSSDQSDSWFMQEASGTVIPEPRVDFCAWVEAASDNSSINIYLYGGWDPTRIETYYDEIWILSLPSFTWISAYNGTNPRFRHTCHSLGSGQVITVGGQRYVNWSRECDWEYMSVGLYNLNTEDWGSIWNPNLPDYLVPETISKVVGGGPNGAAMKLKPDAGWQSVQMAELFTGSTNQIAPVPPAMTVGSRKELSKSALTAIVSCVVVGCVAIILVIALIKWHKAHEKAKTAIDASAGMENARGTDQEVRSGAPFLPHWLGWDYNIRT